MSPHRNQVGLSLIELMVALLIASILIIGVTQIFIDNRKSYSFQQGQMENQESGRFSMMLLQDELSKAGYRRRPDMGREEDPSFKAVDQFSCSFSKGQAIKYSPDGGICLRYQPRDDKERNCLGSLVGETASLDKPYTSAASGDVIVENIKLDGGALRCNGEVLVDGVAALKFEFGVGSTDATPKLLSYKATPAEDDRLVSVRYSMLLRSSGERIRDSMTADAALQAWKSLTGASTIELNTLKAADSGQLYQISQGTVMLRNLMP